MRSVLMFPDSEVMLSDCVVSVFSIWLTRFVSVFTALLSAFFPMFWSAVVSPFCRLVSNCPWLVRTPSAESTRDVRALTAAALALSSGASLHAVGTFPRSNFGELRYTVWSVDPC
ncbi:Uncharacterised protein [Klebsiella michiganensis]|nr:Uncharacterised protein [Klebsiella michiganensis]